MSELVRGFIGKEDIKQWDGTTTTTFSRKTITGGTESLTRINQGGVDVLHVYGSGTNYTDEPIRAALNAIGSTNKVRLWLSRGIWTISNTITFGSNITLDLESGAVLTDDANNANLTINGAIKADNTQQIFDWGNGTGSISITNTVLFFEWFGAAGDGVTDDSAAINTAFGTGAKGFEFITGKTYILGSTITLDGNRSKITGIGAEIQGTDVSGWLLDVGNGTDLYENFVLEGLKVTPLGTTTGGVIIRRIQSATVRDCRFNNTETAGSNPIALQLSGGSWLSTIQNNIFQGRFSIGVNIETIGTDSGDPNVTTVRDNFFNLNGSVAGADPAGIGLNVVSAYSIVSANNSYNNCAGHGFFVDDVSPNFSTQYDDFERCGTIGQTSSKYSHIIQPSISPTCTNGPIVDAQRCYVLFHGQQNTFSGNGLILDTNSTQCLVYSHFPTGVTDNGTTNTIINTQKNFGQIIHTGQIILGTTTNDIRIVAADDITITKIYLVINGATATADEIISISTVTGSMGSITIPSGSSSGAQFTLTPSSNNNAEAGTRILFNTDGGNSNAVIANITMVGYLIDF